MSTLSRFAAYMVGLWRQPHWWAENWSGFVMIAWALIPLCGEPLSTHPGFSVLLQTAPSMMWELLGLTIGLTQVTSLIFNNRLMRGFAAFASAWFFSFILVSFARGGNYAPGMAVYGGYVGINIMAMYKLIRGTA